VPIEFCVEEAGILRVCGVGPEKTSKNLSLSSKKGQKNFAPFYARNAFFFGKTCRMTGRSTAESALFWTQSVKNAIPLVNRPAKKIALSLGLQVSNPADSGIRVPGKTVIIKLTQFIKNPYFVHKMLDYRCRYIPCR